MSARVVSLYMPDSKKDEVVIVVETSDGQSLEFRGISISGASSFHVGDEAWLSLIPAAVK